MSGKSIVKKTTEESEIPMKARRYGMTWNNYQTAVENWKVLLEKLYETKTRTGNQKYGYICGAEEIGESGTPHIQGYIELENSIQVKTVQNDAKKLGIHFALIKVNGSAEQNRNYCLGKVDKKGNTPNPTFWEIGKCKIDTQGERNDLEFYRKMVLEQWCSIDDIMELTWDKNIIWYCEKLIGRRGSGKRVNRVVKWFWGPSGAGKTHMAMECMEEIGLPFWKGKPVSGFFNGYAGQKVAWLDELRPEEIGTATLLEILHEFPHTVNTKGSFEPWLAETIIISTIMPPWEFYALMKKRGDGPYEQLERRIVSCTEFKPREGGTRKMKNVPQEKAKETVRMTHEELAEFEEWKRMKATANTRKEIASDLETI
jgi:hypothetical protein